MDTTEHSEGQAPLPVAEAYARFVAAAENRDALAMKRLLVSNRALEHHVGDDGSILAVIVYNSPEHLEEMLATGISPDAVILNCCQTLLQYAAADGNIALLQTLVSHGVELERRNQDGETALGYAAAYGQLEAVRFLLANGALVNAVEGTVPGEQDTALDATFKLSPSPIDLELRALLRSHGAKRFSELDQSPRQDV